MDWKDTNFEIKDEINICVTNKKLMILTAFGYLSLLKVSVSLKVMKRKIMNNEIIDTIWTLNSQLKYLTIPKDNMKYCK